MNQFPDDQKVQKLPPLPTNPLTKQKTPTIYCRLTLFALSCQGLRATLLRTNQQLFGGIIRVLLVDSLDCYQDIFCEYFQVPLVVTQELSVRGP
jgi:hypothetical protein